MGIEHRFDIPFIAAMALREKQIQQNYRPVIAMHKWFARRPGTLVPRPDVRRIQRQAAAGVHQTGGGAHQHGQPAQRTRKDIEASHQQDI